MLKNFFRVLLTIVGVFLGFGLVSGCSALFVEFGFEPIDAVIVGFPLTAIYIAAGIVFGLIFLFASPAIITWFVKHVKNLEEKLTSMTLQETMSCALGLIMGLVIAFLLSFAINTIPIPYLATAINIIVYAIMAYLGWRVAYRHRADVQWPPQFRRTKAESSSCAKIVDTCAIIDGRILDVAATGFLEGPLVVPSFVIDELRHIADSSDTMRRNRGRSGLDILKKLQKDSGLEVKIEEKTYDDVPEADSKIIKLACETGASVITTDYNLNKVAGVHSVRVLNINDLANAIKPIMLPGEEIRITIVKEGKEPNQGVAYLDDGTMIVVENGRRYMDTEIDAVVTSVLQTSAGRMIFAKHRED